MNDEPNVPEANTDSSGATMVIELESMIKTSISQIDRNKNELKKYKEMLDSALSNDDAYNEATEKAKEAAKAKGKAKANALANPTTKQIDEKIKDLTQEVKDLNVAQSEYLREYQRLSGSSEIQGDDGQVREIVYVAKLVKKSKRGD